jgi:hypothetical protein
MGCKTKKEVIKPPFLCQVADVCNLYMIPIAPISNELLEDTRKLAELFDLINEAYLREQ